MTGCAEDQRSIVLPRAESAMSIMLATLAGLPLC